MERKRMSSKRLEKKLFSLVPILNALISRESIAPTESEYEDPETMMLLHQKGQEIKKMQAMLDQMQQKLNSGT